MPISVVYLLHSNSSHQILMQEPYQPRSLGLLPSRAIPLVECLGFAGVVPHFHFPLCDWLWANHVTNAWDFTSRCSRSERPSETVSDVAYTIGQGWWPKRVCFWGSSETVWLQWIQTFAKVEFRICIVRTGRFGCFTTFPTRLGISCDTLPRIQRAWNPALLSNRPEWGESCLFRLVLSV